MNIRHRLMVPYALILIFLFAHPVWSQESEETEKPKKSISLDNKTILV